MEEKKTEGLLLQALPYLGNQKILKVLTLDKGLISLFVKSKALQSFTNPFLIAEWVYTTGKKEIHLLKDATLRNDFANLRQSYEVITAAGRIAQDLLKSQYQEKPGSGPYALTVAFFHKLTNCLSLGTLIASFRLKLLLHDGLLALQNECIHCEDQALFLTDAGGYCKTHVSTYSLPFTKEEWDLLFLLTYTRKFQEIQSVEIGKSLEGKIEQLFSWLTNRPPA